MQTYAGETKITRRLMQERLRFMQTWADHAEAKITCRFKMTCR